MRHGHADGGLTELGTAGDRRLPAYGEWRWGTMTPASTDCRRKSSPCPPSSESSESGSSSLKLASAGTPAAAPATAGDRGGAAGGNARGSATANVSFRDAGASNMRRSLLRDVSVAAPPDATHAGAPLTDVMTSPTARAPGVSVPSALTNVTVGYMPTKDGVCTCANDVTTSTSLLTAAPVLAYSANRSDDGTVTATECGGIATAAAPPSPLPTAGVVAATAGAVVRRPITAADADCAA